MSRSKPRLPLPWRAKRHEPNLWRKTSINAFRWTPRCSRFGCPRFRRNWPLTERIPLPHSVASESAAPIEFGQIAFVANISCLYTNYIRGEAYLAANQDSAAAAEFQKILDHSGIVWNCWTGALAHLGVARANALHSRTSQGADADAARVRALAAYKDFLTLWKDADPDIPILKEAKAEYAKLRSEVSVIPRFPRFTAE